MVWTHLKTSNIFGLLLYSAHISQQGAAVNFCASYFSFVKEINVKNKELSSENTDGLENPISRFHVTKRLAKEWSVLKENLTCYGEECPLLTGEDGKKTTHIFASQGS